MLTGIGGQGVQLAARVLAEAAVADGREAQLFGSYGGMMRGGNTDASVVIADGPITTPPVLPSTWAAIIVHDAFAEPTIERLEEGSVVIVNTDIVTDFAPATATHTVDVGATSTATSVSSPVMASLVCIGALVGATGLVDVGSLTDAVGRALPAYRQQHAENSRQAILAGHAATEMIDPAWPGER